MNPTRKNSSWDEAHTGHVPQPANPCVRQGNDLAQTALAGRHCAALAQRLGGKPSSLRTDKFLDVSHLSGPELLPNLLFSFERNGLWVRKGHSPRASVFLWTNLYFSCSACRPHDAKIASGYPRFGCWVAPSFPRQSLLSAQQAPIDTPAFPARIHLKRLSKPRKLDISNSQQFSVAVLRPSSSPRCRASACSRSVWVPRDSTAASVDHDTPCHEQRRISPRRTVHIKREKNN